MKLKDLFSPVILVRPSILTTRPSAFSHSRKERESTCRFISGQGFIEIVVFLLVILE
ncbi:MAG: hypothetical protein N2C12_14465 [Planctomycetales bacterium]